MSSASIVIPVFNRAHLVHRAIDTALSQTMPCEVLVVDHGSSDHIQEVIGQYGSDIRYIRREEDRGPIAAWRDGIESATGDFVHITYDDDWIDDSFMERCIAAFDPDVAFVYTRVWLHTDGGERPERSVIHPAGKRSIELLVHYLLRKPLALSPGCAVFRRSEALTNLLPEVPGASGIYGKNTGVGEDLLLFLLTTLEYPTYVHIPEHLAHFLAHPQSITVSALREGRHQALEDSYANAKRYYTSQPGALRLSSGIRGWLATPALILRSRGVHHYVAKAWRRIRS